MARYFDRIAARFARQTEKGIKKYGQVLEDNPRTNTLEVLEYLAEELTDGLMYVEEAIEKISMQKEKLTSLCEGNAQQRQSIQDLSCQAVEIREGLEWIKNNSDTGFLYMGQLCGKGVGDRIKEKCDELLSSSNPGAKVKAVIEAAQRLKMAIQNSYDTTHYNEKVQCTNEMDKAESDLWNALADLEGGTSRD